jgi:hypothetical protein
MVNCQFHPRTIPSAGSVAMTVLNHRRNSECAAAYKIVRSAFILCTIPLWTFACNAQTVGSRQEKATSLMTVSVALSWLPADTETLIVTNGPFLVPPPETEAEADETQSRVLSIDEVKKEFDGLPTGLIGLPEGLLKSLIGRKVTFAMEGSRHFRSPSGLGGMLYEGCDIVVYAGDVASLGNAFMKDTKNVATSIEEIQGQRVATFQSKLEDDVWTTLVAFPKRNILVVATNRDYLRDALARIAGQTGARALPAELPEWKYVDHHAHCWALRHYDKSQAGLDPSSPIGGEKSANFSDDEAIGIVFNLGSDRNATITYISNATNALEIMQEGLFPPQSEPASIKDLRIHYRAIAPGVVQGTFDLNHSESVWYFSFILLAALGHGVYL